MNIIQTDAATKDSFGRVKALALVAGAALLAAGCNPTVKIEQEIRIKVDRDLDQLLADNPDLF